MRVSRSEDPPLLDARTLDELRALDAGTPSFLCDLVREFLESCTSELATIDESLATRDLERVWQLAHGLKGACFMVGATRLGEALTELECASCANDLTRALAQLPAIRRAQDTTRDALLALL